MPRITDTQAIKCPFLDRRTKLLPCQKEMCIYWHNNGSSINSIAKMFKVNKRLIQFILFPERQKRNVELRHERGGTMIYYNKKKHAETTKEHRQYKYNTLPDGKAKSKRNIH